MAKEQQPKHILSTIGDFLSTFIVAVVAMIAVLLVFVRVMNWHMFSIDSGSMSPRYQVNTLIVVKTTEPEEIEVGDVITFVINDNNVLVTHRVVDIDKNAQTFTTKGDANNTNDAKPVLWGNVVGKVILDIPGMGKPLRAITDESNRPVLIGVIVSLFVLSLLWDVFAKRRRKKQAQTVEPEITEKAEE